MHRKSSSERQKTLTFPEQRETTGDPRGDRIVSQNRDFFLQFLRSVFVGNTFDLSPEEIARCRALAEAYPETMNAKTLSEAAVRLDIHTSKHPGLPRWAAIAINQFRRLCILLNH